MTTKKKTAIEEADEAHQGKVALTQPAETPSDAHAKYEYEHGQMRRCHLCGDVNDHLNHSAEPVWFPNLELRAWHIIECHRDFPIEVQRAKIVLYVADKWDEKAESKPATFKIPIISALIDRPKDTPPEKEREPQLQQATPKAKDAQQKGWVSRHPIFTIILLVAIIYLLYSLYLIMAKGYTL